MMSNELDILIVGYNEERFAPEIRTAFRHWQVYAVAAPHAIEGRRFRRAYFTTGAMAHKNFQRTFDALERDGMKSNPPGQLLPFEMYQPEYDVQTFEDAMILRDLRRSRYAV